MTYRRRSLLWRIVVAVLICTQVACAGNATDTPTPVPSTSVPTTVSPPTQSPPVTTSAPTNPPPTQPPTASPTPPPTPPPVPTTPVVKPTPPPSSTSAPEPSPSSQPPVTPPSPATTSVHPLTEPPAPSHPDDSPPSPSTQGGDSPVDAFDPQLPTTSPSNLRVPTSPAGDPSSSSHEASSAADDATNSNLTIILGSVLAGMVCVVVAAVIVRRRLRSVSGDEKMLHGANTAGGSMVFMDSTRPSSVPVLQSNNRVYEMPNLLALPAPAPTKKPPSTVPRTTSRRDEPRTEEASSLYRLSSMHHIPIVDCIDALGNMTRISEAENSDGSSAATTFDNHAADNGFAIDVRGTDDLCRFTRASEHYSESTYDGEFGDHVGFPSDVSRETGWSIGSENVAAPSGEWGGAAAPSHDVRNTDDLLQTTRSMVSIDDSSVRGSSDVWLDTNRFNAMVSTDVHIF